ncbi:hypothetical protein LQ772_06680 [Frateuria edaphi]|uniref:FaeA/PapI family transcriptional regulator n=1 Tax=Frateuria edaphi TaxID=2898793 RepID=UPI001E61833E|nr:FaeA/PapI family transcriptional regulator [Frateuria edaphi]UGB46971.1 hypothetical protein LQ772_06680 [Frateuria edaphi]
MRPLGHISHGTRRIASRAFSTVKDYGQVAVFLGCETGQAAAVEVTDPDYRSALQRHANHLVGVYVDDLSDGEALREQISGDLITHMRVAQIDTPQMPMRERLLKALEQGPLATNDIAQCLGVTACYVRRLLAELRREGHVRPTGHAPGRTAHSNVWSVAA